MEYVLNVDSVGCKEKHFWVINFVVMLLHIGGTEAECTCSVWCMLCDDTASVILMVINRVIRGLQ